MNPNQDQDLALNPTPPQSNPELTGPTVPPVPPVPAESQPFSPFGSQPQNPTTTAPPASFAPVETPTPAASPTPPEPKSKRGLIIGAIVVGAILLLGAAAAVIYTTVFSVTKADYTQAHEQLEVISDAVRDVPSLSSASSSEESANELSESIATFKTENAKLADLKALRNDSELNEKYVAYKEKADAYTSFVESLAPSLEKFFAASTAMKSISDGLTAANIQKIITELEANQDVSDPTIKTYLESSLATFKDMLPIVQEYESATSTAKLAAANKLNTETRELTASARTLTTDLQTRYDEVNPGDSFNALSQAVASKANGS